jgi:hypothetical protein
METMSETLFQAQGGLEPNNRTNRRHPMKKIVLTVALVVAFAAPAMAQNFPNPYLTHSQQ